MKIFYLFTFTFFSLCKLNGMNHEHHLTLKELPPKQLFYTSRSYNVEKVYEGPCKKTNRIRKIIGSFLLEACIDNPHHEIIVLRELNCEPKDKKVVINFAITKARSLRFKKLLTSLHVPAGGFRSHPDEIISKAKKQQFREESLFFEKHGFHVYEPNKVFLEYTL